MPEELKNGTPAFFRVRRIVVVGVLLALTVGGLGIGLPYLAKHENEYTIACDVPGTEVFWRGKRLGVVPLQITARELAHMGAPTPPDPALPMIGKDSWAEGLFFGVEDEWEEKLMFRVPDDAAAKYLSIETPWGRRTKIGQSRHSRDRREFEMSMLQEKGAELLISAPSVVSRGDRELTIQIRLTNIGAKRIVLPQSQIGILWGSFDTRWRSRSYVERQLPKDWSEIDPRDARSMSFSIPAPNVAGDYSVFCVLPSIYSDSKMIRVR